MLEREKITFLFAFVCALLISSALCFAQDQIRTQDIRIRFYGKVVDQYYQPVADANVYMDIYRNNRDKSKYKREQAPPGIKISTKFFLKKREE